MYVCLTHLRVHATEFHNACYGVLMFVVSKPNRYTRHHSACGP